MRVKSLCVRKKVQTSWKRKKRIFSETRMRNTNKFITFDGDSSAISTSESCCAWEALSAAWPTPAVYMEYGLESAGALCVFCSFSCNISMASSSCCGFETGSSRSSINRHKKRLVLSAHLISGEFDGDNEYEMNWEIAARSLWRAVWPSLLEHEDGNIRA